MLINSLPSSFIYVFFFSNFVDNKDKAFFVDKDKKIAVFNSLLYLLKKKRHFLLIKIKYHACLIV